ncbi:hypothetical protein KEU06_14575 [Pseudaminobacter sp. 19-2017]|uniref:2-oxo acid dehydrogenase subunit E2 n=1 Tax=Pseudaminobacter soli (ex Zhang et al. 2022) TaxID=2831468 RepID=A0A942I3E9_9HYPH|nr:hypothetical protein [Pseudaminobacter soli]MBS3649834.1 hypothetical protein [Pseudaminobacter soli]
MRGRPLKLSAPRRLVSDLMHFSIGIPRVTVQRRMNLGPLIRARAALHPRPSWTVLFLKGYGLLSAATPELRRAWVKLPRPQLYEYPQSVGSIAFEREHEGEQAVMLGLIKGPEEHSIPELSAWVEKMRSRPVMEVKEFRRALKTARLPAPLRRVMMWLGLNIGRQRANYFGTFQFSVYSALGAESLNPLTPLTTLLNYGPMDEDGYVNVRILYDHRVMDGANVARALGRFEDILNGEVAEELRSLAQAARAEAARRL